MEVLPLLLIIFCLLATGQACSPNGACGCCGCRAKARARAAKTNDAEMQVPSPEDDGNIFGLSIWNRTDLRVDQETLPLLTNPNHLFHRCCEERALPKACRQLCHFNAYTKQALEDIYLGHSECPLEFVPEIQFCSAQGMDQRKCCVESGVGESLAGGKCVLFCDQTPDKFTPVDHSYLPCVEKLEPMKRCFYDGIGARARQHFGKDSRGIEEF
ncbi:unnamed protein product, partial [Mesorhabditis spiculigera]